MALKIAADDVEEKRLYNCAGNVKRMHWRGSETRDKREKDKRSKKARQQLTSRNYYRKQDLG